MAAHERKEFDKYLKFFTHKVIQVIVQSRQGRKVKTKSNSRGNEWFNLSIQDDRQVASELRRSLEGRLPQPNHPVCVEILMESTESDTLVLEVWSVSIDHSQRDIGVSVSHVLYPRLSLMLKSVMSLARTTPTYRLSRQQDNDLKFTFRVYTGTPDTTSSNNAKDFKHVQFAETSCPYGTISLSLCYRTNIVFPERSTPANIEPLNVVSPMSNEDISFSDSLMPHKMSLPFATTHNQRTSVHKDSITVQPFSAILPSSAVDRMDSRDSSGLPDEMENRGNPSLVSTRQEHEGYIMVDMEEIRPAFAECSDTGELRELLQQCKEVPELDLFSGEHSMDVSAAMKLVEERS